MTVTRHEIRIRGNELVTTIKDMIHEGTVHRITVKDTHGHVVLEIPVTAGVMAAVAAPVITAAAALAALAAEWTIEVERRSQEADTKQWTVEIFITEDAENKRTDARAVLSARGSKAHESVGHARRNPADRPVPEIGDELAAGRALMDLADKLLSDGAADIAQLI